MSNSDLHIDHNFVEVERPRSRTRELSISNECQSCEYNFGSADVKATSPLLQIKMKA